MEQITKDVSEKIREVDPEMRVEYLGPWQEDIDLGSGETVTAHPGMFLLEVSHPGIDERGEWGCRAPFSANHLDDDALPALLKTLIQDAWKHSVEAA